MCWDICILRYQKIRLGEMETRSRMWLFKYDWLKSKFDTYCSFTLRILHYVMHLNSLQPIFGPILLSYLRLLYYFRTSIGAMTVLAMSEIWFWNFELLLRGIYLEVFSIQIYFYIRFILIFMIFITFLLLHVSFKITYFWHQSYVLAE